MENKSIQEENLGVLVKRVDCRIKELVEAADNYTKEMNENYAYFFCWHAESMYKMQIKLAQYRELREVINTGLFEEIVTYLTGKVEEFTVDLLSRGLRRNSTSEMMNLAHVVEAEVKQELRRVFEMFVRDLKTK